jgi:hypothetical protein
MRKKTPRDGSLESRAHGKLCIEFSHCAIFGGGPLVEWDGKKSELRWRDCYGDAWISLPAPTPLQWNAFWFLLEQSGVRNWEMAYSNPNIEDGIGWVLS